MNSYVKHLLATSGLHILPDEITLSSGEKSCYYIDCRMLLLYPEFREEIGKMFFFSETLEGWSDGVDAIGGKGIGSILLCLAIQEIMTKNGCPIEVFTIRTSPKEHGVHPKMVGNIRDKRIIIVDDVMTSGDTIIESIEFAREAGAIVERAVVLVDRSEDATKKVKEKTGVLTNYVYDLKELLQEKRFHTSFSKPP